MHTVFKSNGFRMYFYSDERSEPAHIHVDKGGCSAKVWLQPVTVASNVG